MSDDYDPIGRDYSDLIEMVHDLKRELAWRESLKAKVRLVLDELDKDQIEHCMSSVTQEAIGELRELVK